MRSVMSISLPPELKSIVKAHPEVNWSEVGRSAIEFQVRRLSSGNPTSFPKTRPKNVSVPADLLDEMKRHPDVNWSEIATAAFREHVLVLRGINLTHAPQ